MPGLGTFLSFYIAVLALQLAPGPDMLLIIGRGIGQGRRTALLTATGATLVAALVQLPLLVLGVASILQTSPLAFEMLRWTGAVYLLWLGGKLILGASRRRAGEIAAQRPVSDLRALRDGAINNLTNPKAMVFMFAFLPQFVDPTRSWPVTAQLLFLGAVMKLSGFVVLGSTALGAGTFGSWLSRRPHWIAWQERFAGTVMLGLGIRLALTGDVRSVR